jgi:hypothetical protein
MPSKMTVSVAVALLNLYVTRDAMARAGWQGAATK